MKEGHRGRGEKEVMSMILGISSIADLCLLFKLPQIAGVRIWEGRDRPTPPLIIGYLAVPFSSLSALNSPISSCKRIFRMAGCSRRIPRS
jgi:hypothetical protein